MSVADPRLARPTGLRFPRRTARLRLTAVNGGLFLVSGATLLAITYLLFERATKFRNPHLPKVPHTGAIEQLRLPSSLTGGLSSLEKVQQKLAASQHRLTLPVRPRAGNRLPLLVQLPRLGADQRQLAADQHQLAQVKHQLTQAEDQLAQGVHQLARQGAVEAAQRAADSHQLLVNSGIALAIVAVLALLAGWLVAGRMLRPIRTITRTARKISATSLHERLALHGPRDELKELGDTLDDLFGRLDAAFDAQRHFVANASHELRTPLTAERTLLQVALDDPCTTAEEWRSTAEEVLASTTEQARLLEGLLTLASSEGQLDRRRHVELAAVVEAALEARRPEAEGLGLQVAAALGPAPVEGDERLVERLVANLIDNAVGHNIVGGHVRVSTGTDDGQAVLSVDNTGPVIPPAEVGRLFEPFQRLDPGRTHHKDGHGLGLSIVRAIAAAHGAIVSANAPPGGGLCVSVGFPPPPAGLRAELDAPSGTTSRRGTPAHPVQNAHS